MFGTKRRLRLQSAMEYLMTYGWAILIIAVVLGALFTLGVFNSSSLLGTHCIATPGFTCSSATMGTNSYATVTFSQATGSTLYLQGAACSSAASPSGFPLYGNINVNNTRSTNVMVNGQSLVGHVITIPSGTTFTLVVPCYSSNTLPSSVAIGSAFSGEIWLNYTTTPITVPTATGAQILPVTSSFSVKVT
ncbi:MAG: hypothetical protein QXL16_01475 [Candidatus Micrarchaeaceae archaeon]